MSTEFIASMPGIYAATFPIEETTDHARIVAQRGPRLVHAEPCRAGGQPVLCVVTDDRPGLLALVTDALLVHGLAIRGAHAFCRKRRDGVVEAVDFLALAPAALETEDVEAFVQLLSDLISEDIRASTRPTLAAPPDAPRTRVYFDVEALRRGQYLLLVETLDAQGLLHAVSSALYGQGARIVACQIGTEGGLVRDSFELTSSAGKAWTGAELCDIQLAVLDALPKQRA